MKKLPKYRFFYYYFFFYKKNGSEKKYKMKKVKKNIVILPFLFINKLRDVCLIQNEAVNV